MTRIAIPNETSPKDQRTAMTPINLGKLVRAGAEVQVEAGLGTGCGYPDEQYREAGARVIGDRREMFESADLVLRLNRPTFDEVTQLKQGAAHVSYLDPFNERGLIEALRDRQVSAISMEMIPRTSRAQMIRRPPRGCQTR